MGPGDAPKRDASLGIELADVERCLRALALALVSAPVALLLTATSGGAGVAFTGPTSQPDGVATVIATYRARIPGVMARQRIPGLALALVDRQRVVWQQGFGVTERGEGAKVTVDTLFSAESMWKAFTATAVMRVVQSGQLGLDAPITTYLPGFTVHSAFESHPEQRITLRMLLSHTAGFTHESPLGNNYEAQPGDFDATCRAFPIPGCGFWSAPAAPIRIWGSTWPATSWNGSRGSPFRWSCMTGCSRPWA
jgi:CubicO group peptidase (beta-lactamase class C family)